MGRYGKPVTEPVRSGFPGFARCRTADTDPGDADGDRDGGSARQMETR